MTCIAALKDKKGNIYFAGDRRLYWSASKAMASPNPKVILESGILYGAAGSSPICEAALLSACLLEDEDTDAKKLVDNVFLPSIISQLRQDNWIKDDDRTINVQDDDNAAAWLLIGIRGRLFEVTISNEIISSEELGFPYAIGCGSEVAMGSLLTSKGSKLGCKARLKVALRIAAECCPGCDDNIDIINNKVD